MTKNVSLFLKYILPLLIPLLPAICWSATYYVRSDGHDTSCNGTADAAVASAPNCAYLTIQKAANVVAVGDTVTVKGTNTYPERVTISTNGGTGNPANGTCSSWITLQGSPARTATTYGFRITGNCIEVKDFNVLGSVGGNASCADPNCAVGISVGKSYTKITNNYVSDWRDQPAIAMDPSGTNNLVWANRGAWVTISNNTIYNSQNGILVWGDNITVIGNEVNRLRQWDSNNDCDYSRAWGNNITIRNNFFHGTVKSEISGAHVDCIQTWLYHSGTLTNLSFDNNWCADAHSSGMMQDPNSYNLNFTNNVVWPNGMTNATGALGSGAEVDAATGITHIGNTYYGTSTGPYCASGVTGCVIRNNLVYNSGTYAWQCWGDCVENYNLAYRSGSAIYNESPGHSGSSAWNPHTIHDINPLFVNTSNPLGADGRPFTADDGFRLQAGSPARGSGYGGVDIGAYQSVPVLLKIPLPPGGTNIR